MPSIQRLGKYAAICVAAVMLAACASQKEPAQKQIADIELAVATASPDAQKYVPDQLSDVQSKLADLKASFDKQDYAAVVAGAPAVMSAAQGLASAAAEKKDEIMKGLNDQWTVLSGTLPATVIAIQSRIDFLSKKSNKKAAAGIDLNAAKAGLGDATSLWSKAQAAFAAGNLDEAVGAATDVKGKVDTLAGTLKMNPSAPASATK
jgi:hypothetical protein